MKEPPNPIAILIYGVLSVLLCGFIAGTPAWILGNMALAQSEKYTHADLKLIRVGRSLGMVGTVFSCFVWLTIYQSRL